MQSSHVLSIASLVLVAGCAGLPSNDPASDAGDPTAASDAMAPDATHHGPTDPDAAPSAVAPIDHVFVIVMENHDWSDIAGNPAAPYINDTLLSIGAHAEAYFNPTDLHPSEPNYIWLEAGGTSGLTSDADPSPSNSSTSTGHLVDLLEGAGKSWKSYQEDMPAGCPTSSSGFYAAKHDPFVFFQDVTSSQRCVDHIRSMTELQPDLDSGAVANYVFLTPDLCHDMHGDSACPSGDVIAYGDTWLSQKIPAIMASSVYQAGHSAILVTWDESASATAPIGMIAISPHAKAGYTSTVTMSHSSTLRMIEEIFGVDPMLGAAAGANDLSDLFVDVP